MHTNYRRTALLVFMLLLQSVTRLAAVELKHRELDTTNGLPSNYIISLAQDPQGFVWMATDNGLCRYDGYFVEVFRHSDEGNNALLLSNKLRELRQNPYNGLLFIRLQGELFSCYDTNRRRFIDYSGNNKNDKNYSSCLFTHTGDSWLWYKGKGDGCLEVNYQDGKIKATEYSKENGSLKSNTIQFLNEDSEGNIWIGTDKALYMKAPTAIGGLRTVIEKGVGYITELDGKIFFATYDKKFYAVDAQGKAQILQHPSAAKLGGKSINGLVPYKGQILVVTSSTTFSMVPQTGEINNFPVEMGGEAVFIDDSGNYYMNDINGQLHYFDLHRDAIYHFSVLETNLINKPDTHPIQVTTDHNGYIWIITKGNGFFIYDPSTRQLQHFSPREKGVSPIETDYIQAIMNDHSGNIWISQENMGISVLSTMPRGITRLFADDGLTPNYSNFFRMVRETADGKLWAGNFTGSSFQILQEAKGEDYRFSSIDIGVRDDMLAICKDRQGHQWIGTRNKGISVDGHFYQYIPNDTTSLPRGKVFDILCDTRGRVWVAVNTGALCLALPQTDGSYKFRRFLTENSFMRTVTVLHQTKTGHILVGCANGLIVFHPDSIAPVGGQIHPYAYHYYHKGNSSLGYYETRDIYENGDTIWLASSGGGLYYIPREDLCHPKKTGTLQFQQITTEQGLADNTANTVIADRKGNLWVGMNRGLTRIDKDTRELSTYYLSAHKLGEVYSENSACILPDGKLLFGTKHGLLIFHPDSLSQKESQVTTNTQHPSSNIKAHITSFSVNGSPYNYETTEKGALIPVELSHRENSLIFRFSDLSFEFPYKAEYEYMLKGFDSNWSLATRENEAVYKDLKPGHYVFRVRLATNPEQISEMEVIISQPWWNTWWAWILYLLAGGAIILYIARLLLATYRLQNRIRINRTMSEFKQRFFMNVSHEFRTPLTIIQGSMERMRKAEDLPSSLKQPMSNMQRSTDRLLRLVNQLLEVDKLENGKLSLKLQETDVVHFVRNIVEGFSDVAENKHINLQFLPFTRQHTIYLDRGMMDKILYNLISNALKYTPSRGEVAVRLKQQDDKIVMLVEDTGPGVPHDKQSELFTRFTTPNREASSLGIGLHLTKQLVEAHHGNIRYDDNPNGGSIFTVILPDTDKDYAPEDFLNPSSLSQEEQEVAGKQAASFNSYKEMPPIPLNQRRVMIVEDDEDVMAYIKNELSPYFLLELAGDGQEALERLQQKGEDTIDLIVSDIRMPRMDGLTLLKKVRADDNLFDIPFILLTAISSIEKQVQGFRFGADDYLPKPFSPSVLVTRCLSLIQQRDKLRAIYTQKNVNANDNANDNIQEPVIISERDRNFRKIVDAKIDANLSNPDFAVDDLARVTGYSRTQFYSKMAEVTGYSPKEYIRLQRMNRAAELLHQGEMITVAEVAYQCGFSDPLYFSRCFKQYFGTSPSKYQKES